jgi:hypothetical protein
MPEAFFFCRCEAQTWQSVADQPAEGADYFVIFPRNDKDVMAFKKNAVEGSRLIIKNS